MANLQYGDAARANLRTIVAAMEREMSAAPPVPAVRAAWDELTQSLALGPAPVLRECPRCKSIGMRAAKRCGRCWIALEPLAALPDDPDAGGRA